MQSEKNGRIDMKHSGKCALTRALVALLPGAEIVKHVQNEWHSATFTGQRIMISLQVTGCECFANTREMLNNLPEHEFTLIRGIVADIAVADVIESDNILRFAVESLVLDA
jgi:hypothetical protein